MPEAEPEILSALRALDPKVADFESRLRDAKASCAPGDPMLQSLRDILHLLRQEQQRLRDELKQARAC